MAEKKQTKVGLVFAGVDVTDILAPSLSYLSYTDNEEGEADDLKICLTDTDSVWLKNYLSTMINKSTSGGFRVSATISTETINNKGNPETRVVECGDFEMDNVDYSGSEVVLSCTSLPHRATIRQATKSRAWESVYLSEIAAQMTKEATMSLQFLASTDVFYKRAEQYKVSDIAYLQALCKNAGLSIKAYNSSVVIFDQNSLVSAPSVRTITRNDGSYLYDPKLSTGDAEEQFQICKLRYTNSRGQTFSGTGYIDDYDPENKDNQTLRITDVPVTSNDEARKVAKFRLKLHNKYLRMTEFIFPGDPTLVAGSKVSLRDFGPWSGTAYVYKVVHDVSPNGYTSSISTRMG